jgi:hypothetical protein
MVMPQWLQKVARNMKGILKMAKGMDKVSRYIQMVGGIKGNLKMIIKRVKVT